MKPRHLILVSLFVVFAGLAGAAVVLAGIFIQGAGARAVKDSQR